MSNLRQIPDPATCKNGEYFHNDINSYLFVCVSGRNKQIREWIDINGIRCRFNCPIEPEEDPREDFFRYWSDIENWGGAYPAAGDNLTIPYEWQLILDVDPPILNYLEINSILIWDTENDHTLQAHNIWVNKGRIIIGSE